MFGGTYFAAGYYAGVLVSDDFFPWFAISSPKPIGWRIQQV